MRPVRLQLRHRDPARRRWPALRADPRRSRASRVAGIPLREGFAPRSLSEQPRPADAAVAPACGRTLRARRLGHRDRRSRLAAGGGARRPRRGGDLLLRRRRSGQPSVRRLQQRDSAGPRQPVSVERVGPGKDRADLGQRTDAGRARRGRLRARGGRAVRRQEPVALEDVAGVLAKVPVTDYCRVAGIPEALVRQVARRIAWAASVAVFEDLGTQMNLHSTLNSYLDNLVWLLTGHFGKRGANNAP